MPRIYNLPYRTCSLLLTVLLLSASVSLAQDPTGRPTNTPKTPKSSPKTPTKTSSKSTTPPPATVTLTILSDPPDSAVFINGDQRGETNAEGKAQYEKLALGSYVVEVRKEGYAKASKVFNAGTDSPTLVFKLQPDLEAKVKQFDALVASGNLADTDSQNALQIVNELATKYPDRPEVARMRSVLATKLMDSIAPTIEKTVRQWRAVTREELARALDQTTKANEVKSDEKRVQAELAYLRGVMALRDFQTGTAANGLTTARAEMEKALASNTSFAPAQYQLGVVLLTANEAAAAEAAFLKAAQMQPSWAVGHIGLGAAYSETKKYRESVDAFSKALTVEANNAAALAGLGFARSMRGETREGQRDLDRAKQLDPASGLPYLYMGIYLSQSKKSSDWVRAEQEISTAIQKNSANLEFSNSRAEQLLTELKSKKK